MRLNPIEIVRDWNQAKHKATEIETTLVALRQQRPQVTGIELNLSDPITSRAIDALMKKWPKRFTMSLSGRMAGHVIFGFDQNFGRGGSLDDARETGLFVTSGTDAAERWSREQERALDLLP